MVSANNEKFIRYRFKKIPQRTVPQVPSIGNILTLSQLTEPKFLIESWNDSTRSKVWGIEILPYLLVAGAAFFVIC